MSTTYRSVKFSELKESGVYKDFSNNYYYYDHEKKECWKLNPQRKFANEMLTAWLSKHEGEVKFSLPCQQAYNYHSSEYDD